MFEKDRAVFRTRTYTNAHIPTQSLTHSHAHTHTKTHTKTYTHAYMCIKPFTRTAQNVHIYIKWPYLFLQAAMAAAYVITLGWRPSFTWSEEKKRRREERVRGEEGGKEDKIERRRRVGRKEEWGFKRKAWLRRSPSVIHTYTYTHTPSLVCIHRTHTCRQAEVVVCVPFDQDIVPLDHCRQPQNMPNVYWMIISYDVK